MSKHKHFYKIQGLAPWLDGLVVQTIIDLSAVKGDAMPIPIERIFDIDSIIGDREASAQLPSCGLMIGSTYLDPTDDPTKREYDHTNVYGEFLREGSKTFSDGKNQIEVSYARFMDSLQVSIRNSTAPRGSPKTLYAENFSAYMDDVENLINEQTVESIDELIFNLQDEKQREKELYG